MKNLLKDRYFWCIVALLLVFITYTYFQDGGNVSWLPSDETMPLTDTIIDMVLSVIIITLSAFRFNVRGGIITAIATLLIVIWCNENKLANVDVWVYLLFGGITRIAVAIVIGSYVDSKNKLQKALAEIKTLSGLIPICASCKKIRDDKGYWGAVESYISEHSGATFTHGICPDCMKKLYPEYCE